MGHNVYGPLQLTLLLLSMSAVLGAQPKSGQSNDNAIASYVPCTRDIFSGTRFYGADKFSAATKWITRNQLLVEGISPMAAFTFFNATDPVTGTVETVASVNSTGPLSTKAASWEPLFYLPEDAACSLGRATAQYQAAHPTGPLLLMNVSVLTGVVNQEPGAWQPQGFYARLDSAKDGLLFGAQRLYDQGNRPNPIRSVTKAVTAATFMALTEQGIIGLDDHAADYVPAFRQEELANITFRMLMSHTAGFPFINDEGRALLDPKITLMESATIIAKEYPLNYPPGQGFEYTEIGFQVVGAAMEAATGRSFQSLVKTYITGPIGMDKTNIYNQWKQGFSTNPNPASGGVSSPNDLRAFTRMLLARGVVVGPNGQQRRVLSEASVKEMTTPYPYTNGFGKLVGGSIKQYIPYLEQTKVISPAAAGVLRCVVLGNLWYGLGVPLSQVENGTATNVVLIGGTGQMYVIANFHDPNKALIASASNFQNIIWGYMVSAVVVSEVLTELPQQSLYDSAQMQSACAPVAASSSAALHNQSN